jgi:uncharacterized protein DUF3618
MDKERDPSGQMNPEQELRREIERTRQSMSETVDEIQGEIAQAFDWQTYLRRYPEAFLIGGGALGFLIARAITGSGYSRNVQNIDEQTAALGGDRGRSPKFSPENSSIRRIIDMTASAVLAQVVPIVSSKLRTLLGIGAARGEGGDSLRKNHGSTEFASFHA